MRDSVEETIRALLSCVFGLLLIVVGLAYIWMIFSFVFYKGEGKLVTETVWLPPESVISDRGMGLIAPVERVPLGNFQEKVTRPTVWAHESWDSLILNYYGKADGVAYVTSITVASYGLNHHLVSYHIDPEKGQVELFLRQNLVTESRWGYGRLELLMILPIWVFVAGGILFGLMQMSWPNASYGY